MTNPPANPLAVAEPWDLVADAYTADIVPQFELFAADAIRLALLPPSPRIVDVATGPGTLALVAAADGATVSALDFSPAMIANLERRAAALGITTVQVVQGDGQALPFDSDSYDGAFSMFGLFFFPDRAAGFRELHRVIRPGCRAVASSWAPFRRPFGLVMDAVREFLPGLPFGDGKAPLGDPDEFAQEMTSAGFRDVQIHQITHTTVASSLQAFWKSAQQANAPLVLLQKKLGEQEWRSVSERVYNRLRDELGEGPTEVQFAAYLGVGVK